mgnify:CR=1 FL=1
MIVTFLMIAPVYRGHKSGASILIDNGTSVLPEGKSKFGNHSACPVSADISRAIPVTE